MFPEEHAYVKQLEAENQMLRIINTELGIEATELEAELAAAQAVIAKMREALKTCSSMTDVNNDGVSYDAAEKALAIPSDRTALDAMLAEAEKRGMLKAAEIAENGGAPTGHDFGAWESDIADAIRQAAEGKMIFEPREKWVERSGG